MHTRRSLTGKQIGSVESNRIYDHI